MALSTARIHRVRGRPPLLAAGIISLIHSHSSSVRSLGYIFSFIYPFYTTHEDFSDRLLDHSPFVDFDMQLFDVDTGTFIRDCGSNVVPEVCVVPFVVRSRDIAVDIVITSVVGAGTYTL